MNFSKLRRHKKGREVSDLPARHVVPVIDAALQLPVSLPNKPAPEVKHRSSVTHTFRHAAEINDVALSPDASHLAVASDDPGFVAAQGSSTLPDASVLVYELSEKGLRSVVSAHKSSVQAVDLTRDAAFGVSGDFAGLILVWDAATGTRRATLIGHRRTVTDVLIVPHGDLVISTGIDSSVRLWDVDTEKCRRNLSANVSITAAGISADGNLIACACADSTVRLWDVRVSKQLQNPLHHDGILTDCAVTPDGFVIASTSEAGVLTLWDVGNRRPISTLKPGGKLFGCAITPNASRVLVTGDRGLALFSDISSSSESPEVDFTRLEGHDGSLRVRRCALNNDGTIAVTAGFDHLACLHSLPQGNQDALLNVHAVAAPPMEQMTEMETLFFAFVNDGLPLQAVVVARAIDIDFNMKAVTRLSAVYVAHLCVRTLLGDGIEFSDKDLGGRAERGSFFYRKLYHKVSELVHSQRSYDFAVKILHDARESNILSSHDVNSILGDALSNEYTRNLFSQLSTIMSQVYSELSAHISSMETRVEKLRDKVDDLKTQLDRMNIRKVKEAKLQRYASLVKFGLSLVPIFGYAAMAFVDSSVNIIMSLDLESMTSMGFELFNTTSQFVIDNELARRRSKMSENSRPVHDIWAVEIAQRVLSESFLKRLPEEDRKGLEKGLEAIFERPFKVLKRSVDAVISEYLEDVAINSHNASLPESPHVETDEQKNVVSLPGDSNQNDINSRLVSSFRERSKDREVLSLRQACLCVIHIVNQLFGTLETGISEALCSYASTIFLDETHENIYSLVNEAIFVKVGNVVCAHLRQVLSMQLSTHFNRASVGDDVLYGAVAKRLIIGVLNLHSTSLNDRASIASVEEEIEIEIDNCEEVNCTNFIRIAALAILRQQRRLQMHKSE